MDAEEKKLSPNPEARPKLSSRSGFKLHYFPDIPVDASDNGRICVPLTDKFQRARYNDAGADCTDLSANYANEGLRPHQKSSTNERFDVQAYHKGFEDGLEKGTGEGELAGFERATQKLEPLLDSLQQGILQLKNLRQDTYRIIEKEVVELALAIARKVICREIQVDKQVVAAVAREALAKVEVPGMIKIKMNPADLEFINETKYQISELIDTIDNVTLEAEDNIPSGGCVIETNSGEIDARIDQQLQAIEESFRTALDTI